MNNQIIFVENTQSVAEIRQSLRDEYARHKETLHKLAFKLFDIVSDEVEGLGIRIGDNVHYLDPSGQEVEVTFTGCVLKENQVYVHIDLEDSKPTVVNLEDIKEFESFLRVIL